MFISIASRAKKTPAAFRCFAANDVKDPKPKSSRLWLNKTKQWVNIFQKFKSSYFKCAGGKKKKGKPKAFRLIKRRSVRLLKTNLAIHLDYWDFKCELLHLSLENLPSDAFSASWDVTAPMSIFVATELVAGGRVYLWQKQEATCN